MNEPKLEILPEKMNPSETDFELVPVMEELITADDYVAKEGKSRSRGSKRILTLAQVADFLGVTVRELGKLRREGKVNPTDLHSVMTFKTGTAPAKSVIFATVYKEPLPPPPDPVAVQVVTASSSAVVVDMLKPKPTAPLAEGETQIAPRAKAKLMKKQLVDSEHHFTFEIECPAKFLRDFANKAIPATQLYQLLTKLDDLCKPTP
jgi:hypothetical protein